jgi:hypothetical protein
VSFALLAMTVRWYNRLWQLKFRAFFRRRLVTIDIALRVPNSEVKQFTGFRGPDCEGSLAVNFILLVDSEVYVGRGSRCN